MYVKTSTARFSKYNYSLPVIQKTLKPAIVKYKKTAVISEFKPRLSSTIPIATKKFQETLYRAFKTAQKL